MALRIIEHNSDDYRKMVDLRYEILRKPLGLQFHDHELAKEEQDILIGAFDDDKIRACCVLTDMGSKICRLRQMAVAGTLQGKGIGASLMYFAENIARERGFNTLIMHARKSALGFYEKLGYQVNGGEFEEVTIPHYEMQKNL